MIKLIAAIGENNELGKNNKLIWRLPLDLKFFRATTLDNYVVMGSKTFESLPKALDRRTMFVVSSRNLEQYSDIIRVDKIDDLVYNFIGSKEDLFVIGGASVYEQFLPFCEKMYLTEIQAHDYEADAYFPQFNKAEWNSCIIDREEENGIKYEHKKYVRKKGYR